MRPWSARLAAFLRAGSAMAGASLALVLALNLEMAPLGPIASPEASDLGAITAGTSATRGEGARQWDGRRAAGIDRELPTATYWLPTPSEQLPLARITLAQSREDADEPPAQPAEDVDTGPSVVLHLVPFDAAAMSASSETSSDDTDDEAAQPAIPPVGGPS